MHPHLIYILTIFCKLLHYNLLAVLHVCRSIELSREVVVNSIVNLDIVDEETCRKSLCVEVRTDVAVLYACVANASEVERYRTPANWTAELAVIDGSYFLHLLTVAINLYGYLAVGAKICVVPEYELRVACLRDVYLRTLDASQCAACWRVEHKCACVVVLAVFWETELAWTVGVNNPRTPLVIAVTNSSRYGFNRCKSTTFKFLSRDTKSARDKNGTKPRKNKAFYVIVGLSARIVYRQAPLVNIEIKHWITKQYKDD